jgi:hypothetical protein
VLAERLRSKRRKDWAANSRCLPGGGDAPPIASDWRTKEELNLWATNSAVFLKAIGRIVFSEFADSSLTSLKHLSSFPEDKNDRCLDETLRAEAGWQKSTSQLK